MRIVGRRDGPVRDILEIVDEAEARTAATAASTCRSRSTTAAAPTSPTPRAGSPRRCARAALDPRPIDEAAFEARLSTAGAPPPDLIIRTSGEQRLSNFLLWEARLRRTGLPGRLWPDYGPDHLKAAIDEFHARDRRYGGADVDDVLAAG